MAALLRNRSPWLAILSGCTMALSQPGYGFDVLAFISLTPFFFALDGLSLRRAFWVGWLAGFVFFAILLYWLFALSDWAGPWITLGYLALVGYLALCWGAFASVASCFSRRISPWLCCIALPSLWVFLEFLRSLTRFGFTWGYLSDAFYARPELIQTSAFTGAWALSFLIVLTNFMIYLAIKHRQVRYVIVAITVIVMDFLWGSIAIHIEAQKRPIEIAIVHSHVDQRDRSNPSQLDRLLELYVEQVELVEGFVDLIILPETILPGFILRNNELFERFSALSKAKKAWLLLGTVDYKPQGPEGIFNTAVLISPEGRLASEYNKVQLVPFSTEYFPFLEQLKQWEALKNLLVRVPLGSLTPGNHYKPLQGEIGTLATPICFESIFPAISRAFVRAGAQAILTITNDGWFKDGLELPQHFAKGVFRAVETGRYFVQASNSGISGIVSDKGFIIASTDAKKETTLRGRVVLHEGWTLYTRYGDWFVYLCVLILLGSFTLAFSRPSFTRR